MASCPRAGLEDDWTLQTPRIILVGGLWRGFPPGLAAALGGVRVSIPFSFLRLLMHGARIAWICVGMHVFNIVVRNEVAKTAIHPAVDRYLVGLNTCKLGEVPRCAAWRAELGARNTPVATCRVQHGRCGATGAIRKVQPDACALRGTTRRVQHDSSNISGAA